MLRHLCQPISLKGFTGNRDRIDTGVWVRGQVKEERAQEEGREEGAGRRRPSPGFRAT